MLPLWDVAGKSVVRFSHTTRSPIISSHVGSHHRARLVRPPRRQSHHPPSGDPVGPLAVNIWLPFPIGSIRTARLPPWLDGSRLGLQVEGHAAVKQGGAGSGNVAGSVERGGGQVSRSGCCRGSRDHARAIGALDNHRPGNRDYPGPSNRFVRHLLHVAFMYADADSFLLPHSTTLLAFTGTTSIGGLVVNAESLTSSTQAVRRWGQSSGSGRKSASLAAGYLLKRLQRRQDDTGIEHDGLGMYAVWALFCTTVSSSLVYSLLLPNAS